MRFFNWSLIAFILSYKKKHKKSQVDFLGLSYFAYY